MNYLLYFLLYLPIVTTISVYGILFLANYKWYHQLFGGILLGTFFGFLLYIFGMHGGFLIQVPVLAIAFYRWSNLFRSASKTDDTKNIEDLEFKKDRKWLFIGWIKLFNILYFSLHGFI